MASTPDLNYQLITVARRHRYLAGRLFEPLGIHPGQEGALRLLWEHEPRTQTELATNFGVELATMAKTLTVLERNGFVTRTPSASDRRAVDVTLTHSGRQLRAALDTAWDTLERHTTAGLTPAEVRQLQRLLTKVADNLRDPTRSPATHQRVSRTSRPSAPDAGSTT